MPKARSYTDEEFIEAVANNKSWRQVLFSLGLREGGGTYTHIKNLAKKLNLSTEHMTGKGWNSGDRYVNPHKRPLSDILVEDSTYTSAYHLKHRLWREGLLEEKCDACGIGNEWQGRKLALQLDHISGVRQDNRIENLRILCPNCHSQTNTFAGKNKRG